MWAQLFFPRSSSPDSWLAVGGCVWLRVGAQCQHHSMPCLPGLSSGLYSGSIVPGWHTGSPCMWYVTSLLVVKLCCFCSWESAWRDRLYSHPLSRASCVHFLLTGSPFSQVLMVPGAGCQLSHPQLGFLEKLWDSPILLRGIATWCLGLECGEMEASYPARQAVSVSSDTLSTGSA